MQRMPGCAATAPGDARQLTAGDQLVDLRAAVSSTVRFWIASATGANTSIRSAAIACGPCTWQPAEERSRRIAPRSRRRPTTAPIWSGASSLKNDSADASAPMCTPSARERIAA